MCIIDYYKEIMFTDTFGHMNTIYLVYAIYIKIFLGRLSGS